MPLQVEMPPGGKHQQGTVVIGIINNMPDSALQATEKQFSALLAGAAGARPVRLRPSYLPEIARGPQARERIDACYWPLEELLADAPDALIVTGAEPHASDLEAEPYWQRTVDLIQWAQAHGTPSVWSCLAAHAAVLALDGIRRQRLSEKRFGVFTHSLTAQHPLLRGVCDALVTPHSRWNELPVEALRSAGYTLGSISAETGADCFVREGEAPLLCFQGHPEYEAVTLLLEYRRDVGRFLRGERDAWPAAPRGYFSPDALTKLGAFRAKAENADDPSTVFSDFPTQELAAGLTAHWHGDAVRIYSNWLDQVSETCARARPFHRIRI